MNPKEVAANHLRDGKVMQIVTLHEGNPRANSVYYVASPDNKNVYWMSEPNRRHSKDIEVDVRAAGAIAIKVDWPVIGLQFEGQAYEVTDLDEIEIVANQYGAKYDGYGGDLHERYRRGVNKHHLYKLVIANLELFDEVNFPGGEVVKVTFD